MIVGCVSAVRAVVWSVGEVAGTVRVGGLRGGVLGIGAGGFVSDGPGAGLCGPGAGLCGPGGGPCGPGAGLCGPGVGVVTSCALPAEPADAIAGWSSPALPRSEATSAITPTTISA